jgi:hypothetical protein
MQIHIAPQGQQEGPFTLDQLNLRLRDQGLPADTMAWYEGCPAWIPVREVPGISLPPPPAAPPSTPPPLPVRHAATDGDGTGGLIPYKNPSALIAYYLGIFGLLPIIGILLAIPAVILGFKGLSHRKVNPAAKGAVHAWVGISLGTLSILYNSLIIFALVAGIMSTRR